MQIATVRDGRPWIATVYFVVDETLNLYWLSWPERRHSQEIAAHAQVAAAIVTHAEQPVVGMQCEGQAHIVTDTSEVQTVMELYTRKYGQGDRFAHHHQAGTNHHEMYRLAPRSMSLFDEARYATDSPIAVDMAEL